MRASFLTIGLLTGLAGLAGCSNNPGPRRQPSARIVVPTSRPLSNPSGTVVKVPPGHFPAPGQCRV
ncbi:MAG: hypothetical protein ACREMA_14925, partial [Longimicrobiales bacterium]